MAKSRIRQEPKAGRLLALAMCVSLPACGGDGSSSAPTPVATPTPGPSSASLEIAQNGTAQICFSPVFGKTFRFAVPVQITESAGLGAAANFARLSLLDATGAEIERAEVTAQGMISALGTNRIAARGTLSGTLNFDFNSSDFVARRLFVNLTDTRGNNHDLIIGQLEAEVVLFCTALRNASETGFALRKK